MSTPWGFVLVVVVFFGAMFAQITLAWLVGRFCATNTRVEAAEDAAREAELQQIVEAGR